MMTAVEKKAKESKGENPATDTCEEAARANDTPNPKAIAKTSNPPPFRIDSPHSSCQEEAEDA